MSKIESPFHIEGNPDFRFALVLESRSVEAHSLMDSGDAIDRENLKNLIDHVVDKKRDPVDLLSILKDRVIEWKETHK